MMMDDAVLDVVHCAHAISDCQFGQWSPLWWRASVITVCCCLPQVGSSLDL